MFCPQCKAEYVDGITICADCQVSLVNELPEEKKPVPTELIPIPLLEQSDLSMIASLLRSEDIPYHISLGGIGLRPRILVRDMDMEDVTALLEGYGVLQTEGEEEERKRVDVEEMKNNFPKLFQALNECILRHNPVDVEEELLEVAYEPLAASLIPRLPQCVSGCDIVQAVHDEFANWYGAEAAGPPAKYQSLASELLKIWKENKNR